MICLEQYRLTETHLVQEIVVYQKNFCVCEQSALVAQC